MTRKDYIILARAIETVAADYKGGFLGILNDLTDELATVLAMDNPSFDRSRFKAAALGDDHEAQLAAYTAA